MTALSKDQRQNFRAWAAALLSGKYEQTTARLTNVVGVQRHCCLGVVCQVRELPSREWGDETDKYLMYDFGRKRQSAGTIPLGVFARWFGEEAEQVNEADSGFADMNDTVGFTFEQIACVILMYLEFDRLAEQAR